MPHWINLSYYESARRKARGKRKYRARLIPPAGLKVERRRTFVDAEHMPRLTTFTDEGGRNSIGSQWSSTGLIGYRGTLGTL